MLTVSAVFDLVEIASATEDHDAILRAIAAWEDLAGDTRADWPELGRAVRALRAVYLQDIDAPELQKPANYAPTWRRPTIGGRVDPLTPFHSLAQGCRFTLREILATDLSASARTRRTQLYVLRTLDGVRI